MCAGCIVRREHGGAADRHCTVWIVVSYAYLSLISGFLSSPFAFLSRLSGLFGDKKWQSAVDYYYLLVFDKPSFFRVPPTCDKNGCRFCGAKPLIMGVY